MLLLLIPQGTAPIGQTLHTQASQVDALYRLGFQNASDLNQAIWLTSAELQHWSDEAVSHLAAVAGVFLTYDQSVQVAAGTAQYSLPTGHVYTVLAAFNNGILWITPVAELWALDADWQATAGNPDPKRCSLDAGGLGTATLYPLPTEPGTLSQVLQQVPASTGVLPLPSVLQDYFTYSMLAGARGKESEHAQPEMAQHYRERLKLYDQVCEHLWGPGE